MQAVTSSSFLTYQTLSLLISSNFVYALVLRPEVAWRSVWESPMSLVIPLHPASTVIICKPHCHQATSPCSALHAAASLLKKSISHMIFTALGGQTRTIRSSLVNPYYHIPQI